MKDTQTGAPLNRQDVVIHLRDMVLYVLLRWRSLLAFALAAAVLLAGVNYWQAYSSYRAATQAVTTPGDHQGLSAEDLAAVTAVRQRQAAVIAQQEYNGGALLMQVDPAAAPTGNLVYLVFGDRAYEAVALYRKYLTRAEMYASLPGCEDMLTACPAELLTTTIERDELYGDNKHLFMTIQVLAPTEELCRQMMDLIKSEVQALTPTVQAQTGAFTCSLAYERLAILRQPTLLESQQSNHTKLTTLQTALAAAQDKLTATQREYLGMQTTSLRAAPAVPAIPVKRAVLGFAAGLLLSALWYALRYVFEKRVQSKQDLIIRYGAPVFGGIHTPARKKVNRVDNWLVGLLRDEADPLSLVERQVALAAVQGGYRHMYLADCGLVSAEQEQLSGLQAQLEAKGVSLTVGTCPPSDGDALEQMATADAILPTVKVGESRHPAIYRTLELAQQLNRPVVGILLLQ